MLVPVALLAQTDGATLRNCLSPQKAVLLGLFWIHYFNRLAVHACRSAMPVPDQQLLADPCRACNRSLIYPFRTRGAKPTPAAICMLASIFCTTNGLLQAGCHPHRFHCWYHLTLLLAACATQCVVSVWCFGYRAGGCCASRLSTVVASLTYASWGVALPGQLAGASIFTLTRPYVACGSPGKAVSKQKLSNCFGC